MDTSYRREIDAPFTAVDVETTGFRANGPDRIVEIATVCFSSDGITDRFVSLVNPERDVGPTHIHGIHASDVADAPRFSEIAGDVIARLDGAVMIAHNASFDYRFLMAELARIGYKAPPLPYICTLELSHDVHAVLPNRQLATCCQCLGIPLGHSHSALDDASATASLFLKLSSMLQEPVERLRCKGALPPHTPWPPLESSREPVTRDEGRGRPKGSGSYLASLIRRLPSDVAHGQAIGYFELLDRVLEDREVTETEAGLLYNLAEEHGFTADEVETLHCSYLEALVGIALADNSVSTEEHRDLLTVANLLAIPPEELEDFLTDGKRRDPTLVDRRAEFVGKSVCFTGTCVVSLSGERMSREMAEQLAVEAGMIVRQTVTRDLDILVVADPATQSGKARKATGFGARIIVERAFWPALGIRVN